MKTRSASAGGIYDEELKAICKSVQADVVVLIVAGGKRGNGIAVMTTPEHFLKIPTLLERLAEQIRSDMPSKIELISSADDNDNDNDNDATQMRH